MLTPLHRPQNAAHPQLRRQARLLVLFAAAALALAGWALGRLWRPALAARWLVPAGLVLLAELWLLFRYLGEHTAPGEASPLPMLGPGNGLTLLRGLAVALMSGFLFLPRPPGALAWLPALLYTGGALLDIVDGYAARRAGTASPLGAILDVEFDSLAVFLVTALAVWYGNLPTWFIPLGAARYLFMWGQARRVDRGLPIWPLVPSQQRRVTAGTFMAFLSAMLWPIVHPPGTYLAALVFALPYTTIFLRDWLVVSGALDPSSAAYRRGWDRPAAAARRWLPVVLRLAILALVTVARIQGRSPAWGGFLASAGLELPADLVPTLDGLLLVAAAMVGVGILTRLAALPVIVAAAADLLTVGLAPGNGILLAAACALPILGGGAYVLWEPESRGIFRQRVGERAA